MSLKEKETNMKTTMIIVILGVMCCGCETMDSFEHGAAYGMNPTGYDRYMNNYMQELQFQEYQRQQELNRQQQKRLHDEQMREQSRANSNQLYQNNLNMAGKINPWN